MKRLSYGLLFILLVTLAALPAAAQAPAGREGVHVELSRGFTIGNIQVQLHAVKLVDGAYRQSEVHFVYNSFVYSVDETFVVPIDADYLEVSRDLGWGGLDATVWVTRTNNQTGEQEEVPLVLNLDLYATQRRSSYDGTYFSRAADVRGTITLAGNVIDFSWPLGPANSESGYNFSDQWPGR
jgi:hypothetical protein